MPFSPVIEIPFSSPSLSLSMYVKECDIEYFVGVNNK